MKIFITIMIMIAVVIHSIGCSMADRNIVNGHLLMSIGFGLLCSTAYTIMLYINIV